MIQIETRNDNLFQFIISDATRIQWSSHYGSGGGGFGYLKFTLNRRVGWSYFDIGFGYRTTVTKCPGTILFDGQIRQIEEVSSPDGDQINITALGWSTLMSDEEILRAFCDTNLSRWSPSTEIPTPPYRPDLFMTGSNALGLYFNASTQETANGDYTELEYQFNPGEIAEKISFDLSMVLGNGVLFDGQVDSTDVPNNYVYYKNDSGESVVQAGQLLFNSTQSQNVTVSAIDTGLNRITISGAISSWVSDDELAVYGPKFNGKITDIVADIVTYSDDLGEDNLSATQALVNVTQKAVATISSVDTGANTITVTDEDDVSGWSLNDVIAVAAPLFEATFSSSSTVTITYTSPIGERIVSSATDWVLHNVTQSQVATVDSWNAGSDQVDVTDSADISTWVLNDIIRIYSPYTVEVLDSNDVIVWPTTDWRLGAISQTNTAVSELTTGTPSSFKIRFRTYIAGTANEYSFAQISSLKAYSTTKTITANMLAEYAGVVLFSRGITTVAGFIQATNKVIEPMVYEFKTLRDALEEASNFGNSSGKLVAWGVTLDSSKTIYMETYPEDTKYIIKRAGGADLSSAGDVQSSYQQVTGVYTDKLDRQQFVGPYTNTDAYFGGGFRHRYLRLDNVDTAAVAAVSTQAYLSEVSGPLIQTSFTVSNGAIFNQFGAPVPFDEVVAGGNVVIHDWRNAESGSFNSSDIGAAWVKEFLVAVEIDYDAGTATLIPGNAKKTFEHYISELSKLVS